MFFGKSKPATTLGIVLGATYQDQITGFKGIATGVCAYISGCNQALLAPPVKDGAALDAHWYDIQRLKMLSDPHIVLDNAQTPGHDKSAPIR